MRFSNNLPVALIGAFVLGQIPAAIALAPQQQFNNMIKGATVRIDLNDIPAGSGVIFSRRQAEIKYTYYVLTAKHVMSNIGRYQIKTFSDQNPHTINHESTIQLPNVDLAILKFESSAEYPTIAPVKLEELNLTERMNITFAGYPGTTIGGLVDPPIITAQIISIPSKPLDGGYNLVYNNSGSDGMSGGPILNEQGQLIGIHGRGGQQINSGNLAAQQIQSSYGTSIKAFLERVSQAAITKGNEQLNRRKNNDAIADFSLALEYSPNLVDAYIGRGRAYLGLEKLTDALKDADKAIEEALKVSNNNQLAAAYVLRGQILAKEGKNKEAIADYNRAIERNSTPNFIADVRRLINLIEPSQPQPQPQPQTQPQPQPQPTTPPKNPIAGLQQNWTLANTLQVQSKVFAVALSPDGQTLASGTADGKIRLWNLATGGVRILSGGHSDEVRAIAFSKDGTKLASGDEKGGIKIWNVRGGTARPLPAVPRTEVTAVSFSRNGQDLAIGLSNGTIKIWQENTRKWRANLAGHERGVSALVYSPNGEILASSGADKMVKLWNMGQQNYGRQVHTFNGHQDWVFAIAFSPNGQTLVSGSLDRTIKVWDVNTRQLRLDIPLGQGIAVYEVAISPNGQTLAAASNKGIRLWNLSNGQPLETLSEHTDQVRSLAFISNQRLASGSEDSTIRIWEMKSPDRSQSQLNNSQVGGSRL